MNQPGGEESDSVWKQLPLPPHAGCIRLLELYEGSTTMLTCSMKVVSIEDPPPYHALSYRWGKAGDITTVLCNGIPTVIQENLGMALQRLATNGYRTVWVDAMCIDQSNADEKSHQVSMMGLIYQTAQSAVVWLGAPADNSTRALEVIQQLAHVKRTHFDAPETAFQAFQVDQKKLIEYGLPDWADNYDPRLESLSELLSSSWASRAWVLQEVLLAPDVACMWGEEIMPLHHFQDAYILLFQLPAWRAISERGLINWDQRIAMLPIQRRLLRLSIARNSSDFDIFFQGLLSNHYQRQCDDPRDKVYSLLNILHYLHRHGGARYSLKPDYLKPVERIYSDFMAELLVNMASLDALTFLRGEKSRYGAYLPSWVIDWTGIQQYSLLAGGATNYAATPHDQKEVRIESNLLQLRCQTFDTLQETSILPEYWDHHTQPLVKSKDAYFANDWRWIERNGPVFTSWLEVCPQDGQNITGMPNGLALHAILRLEEEDSKQQEVTLSIEMWLKSITLLVDMFRAIQKLGVDSVSATDLPAGWETTWAFMSTGKIVRSLKGHLQGPAVRLARTTQGYYCSVPFQARPGDEIILCAGGRTPFVCRRSPSNGDRWIIFGGCYVYGIMQGSAWDPEKTQYRYFE